MKAKVRVMFLPLEMYCLLEIVIFGPKGEDLLTELGKGDRFTIKGAHPIKLLGEHPDEEEVIEEVARTLAVSTDVFISHGETLVEGEKYHDISIVQPGN